MIRSIFRTRNEEFIGCLAPHPLCVPQEYDKQFFEELYGMAIIESQGDKDYIEV